MKRHNLNNNILKGMMMTSNKIHFQFSFIEQNAHILFKSKQKETE